ncbi:hypothetical protein OH809_45305 (plasmid) [Streptomyces sp. NBC_00873]|uniref:hypothetical protein n=1 Tax=Streptomyces sp. NBC_00873 TaxID=2975852 RepID=UPI0037DC7861|nr:hypothetical protein OH809_45305 [Streptomyces sp. NBC_00873]
MAIQTIVPYSVASDMTELDDIRDQLKDTGHPVATTDIERWIREQDLYTEKYRHRVYVSYSDILMAHKDWIADKA